jgi:hypothetical protein
VVGPAAPGEAGDHAGLVTRGLYVGSGVECFELAAKLSVAVNFKVLDEEMRKVVVYLDPEEFHTTWLGNKAIYRTRMAIADGGELLSIAPGVNGFGEQPEVDAFIRKYGYRSTPEVMAMYRKNADMQDLAHATAHLMHGTSEGRFKITYAPGHLTKSEVEGVGYGYADLKETMARYNPEKMKEGWNTMPDGEKVFFISTPSAGLWSTKAKLAGR